MKFFVNVLRIINFYNQNRGCVCKEFDICFNVPKKDQTLIGPELVKIYIIEDDLNPKSNILKLAFYTNCDFIIDANRVKHNDEVYSAKPL